MSKGSFADHKKIIALATPMILANITTPLVGLVDTAVLGRMDSPTILAGASISALILTQIVWICGFLRMSVTGLSAQAFGSKNETSASQALWQGLFLALVIAVVLIAAQSYLFRTGAYLAGIGDATLQAAQSYFEVRVWGLFAALGNLVLIGWMIGRQLTRQVLAIQIVGNVLNVLLNIGFVYGLGWSVKGVALATVIAEISMCLMAFTVVLRITNISEFSPSWLTKKALWKLLSLNASMLMRNIILQMCLAFLTLQGARYGVTAAAVNAIMLQFFALIALGLDGIAYAVEALVGEAAGKKSRKQIAKWIAKGTFWSAFVAGVYALVFVFFTRSIAEALTQHQDVITSLMSYYIVIVLLPLLGHWCFLFDGIAIGLTRAQAMRNTMLLSAVVGYFPVWWLFSDAGNVSLWYAMLAFLTLRGISLGGIFYREYFLQKATDQTV